MASIQLKQLSSFFAKLNVDIPAAKPPLRSHPLAWPIVLVRHVAIRNANFLSIPRSERLRLVTKDNCYKS